MGKSVKDLDEQIDANLDRLVRASASGNRGEAKALAESVERDLKARDWAAK
jgi:hypothetical protein